MKKKKIMWKRYRVVKKLYQRIVYHNEEKSTRFFSENPFLPHEKSFGNFSEIY